jgi:hypothetical protein
VPGRFFKIGVWAQNGQLCSLGMIADQRPVIKVWPEKLFKLEPGESLDWEHARAEAFQDSRELNKVHDFLTTIASIEAETGLDFGKAVRDADIRKAEKDVQPDSLEQVSLKLKEVGHRRGRSAKRPVAPTIRGFEPAKPKKVSI